MRKLVEGHSLLLFFGLLGVLVVHMLWMPRSYAALSPIFCSTSYGERSFTIQGATIAFVKEKKQGRSISSILESKTQNTHLGFRKVLYKGVHKHQIVIRNLNKFDSNEDFMAVTSPKGHKMTYPLHCTTTD